VARGADWWTFPVTVNELDGVGALIVGMTADLPVGEVWITSADAGITPSIDHHFQSVIDNHGFDTIWQSHLELNTTNAFRRSGTSIVDTGSTTDILNERLGSAQHPVSGCAIGQVVDSDLAVIGADNLYIADASVFPAHVTNNPNLTCMMIGEQAAEIVAASLSGDSA
jgi:choline dehydrogenase-like flavoprotein